MIQKIMGTMGTMVPTRHHKLCRLHLRLRLVRVSLNEPPQWPPTINVSPVNFSLLTSDEIYIPVTSTRYANGILQELHKDPEPHPFKQALSGQAPQMRTPFPMQGVLAQSHSTPMLLPIGVSLRKVSSMEAQMLRHLVVPHLNPSINRRF